MVRERYQEKIYKHMFGAKVDIFDYRDLLDKLYKDLEEVDPVFANLDKNLDLISEFEQYVATGYTRQIREFMFRLEKSKKQFITTLREDSSEKELEIAIRMKNAMLKAIKEFKENLIPKF